MSRRGLRADSTQFTLEGKPFRILGGSVHYFRVPRPYWRDRLLQMKACGLNTLTTYVPWNLHEPERGTFHFHDQLDLKSYIRLAAEMGLWVILRPGPYICAEWDLGGLPSWLLQDKDMQLRTTYPGFVNAVNLYFDKLIPTVKPLMFEEGGPIIAVQVENEYGSYAKDEEYMPFIRNCLQSRGVNELLMTSDNWEGLKYGGVAGGKQVTPDNILHFILSPLLMFEILIFSALKTINFQRLSVGAIQHLADMQPQKPLLVMEYWSGWFDVWGEHHHVFHAEDMLAVVSELLSRGVSINLYMFHGGTNFGFMNGALDFGTYKPQVTSYDYDAPLSEAGDCTMKCQLLRNLFSQYHSEPLPQVPSPQERRAYEPVVMQQHLSLWDSLHFTDKPHRSEKALNMENLPVNNNNGQSYGYTLYETTVTSGGALNSMNNIRDRALVFVEREYVGCLDYKTQKVTLPEAKGERMLSFLVENCGRVNYGKALNDQRKGIVGDIVLNHSPLRGFNIFCLDMKPRFINRLTHTAQWKTDFRSLAVPGFLQARLNVDGSPRDTFIQMTGWGKGVVFVNGQNLGRYWFIGPQRFLYLPGHWLRSGENQIILFEEQRTNGEVVFTENADHGKTIDVYKLPFCTLL
ncbi:beta-galactosidase-1-like protein 2 isoform X1 [Oryzias latipes]|uniref:beta-galactosidase-1-like protein 2 isoform X1 n=1 Tax=Oryzias latipes TaxID=8090 RepID=UPI000CE1B999|nr:beta-galactosidase-1-like protein 2 isoform X1 [Oryzias latipes]XP_023817749.1 beta-galactosidase-1-like protein 2 isoform X1 [Oryzias latipes]XP_023817750.1 beta-galactosidase-1-like protein 2 isoform X1 [Oryzias latipes]